ncbi:hypothetical protein E2C01_088135 [Portunus trituberculatus]|uniref:Uncharacterized protein n=1 Tax=Portunus trituberculatus TaxID=210409 RepID=A0A5B7J8E3_PORTR|nr:hypothetical protein [Portunus trituberculatus]
MFLSSLPSFLPLFLSFFIPFILLTFFPLILLSSSFTSLFLLLPHLLLSSRSSLPHSLPPSPYLPLLPSLPSLVFGFSQEVSARNHTKSPIAFPLLPLASPSPRPASPQLQVDLMAVATICFPEIVFLGSGSWPSSTAERKLMDVLKQDARMMGCVSSIPLP